MASEYHFSIRVANSNLSSNYSIPKLHILCQYIILIYSQSIGGN
nr:MAG TPA: hypothetical protein [Caudoviricetes sp.]